ncbi:MAG: Sensory transduction histidine kinase [Parcubacteria group bacterium GW2011_GWA2_43_11]|nr:MAG: Sensory transduction histidine kinase [Parcubacteria group bacterium GW2011_GWC2_42_11]KKS86114.1 MAG: Sensory transduction histidine kinase [Parcubacteria group bacterium GW2011_GWA2_43_11]
MTRIKIIGITIVSILLLTGTLYIVSNKILLDSYRNIEHDQMVQHLIRVDSAVKNFQSNLGIKLRDWSQWDDTFQFVSDRNEEYVTSNLAVTTLQNLEINFIGFFDIQGGLIFSVGTSLTEEQEIPSESIMREVASKVLTPPSPSEFSGVLEVQGKILFIEVQTIKKTSGEGYVGNMLFGRYLDESVVTELGELTQLDLTFTQLHGQDLLSQDLTEIIEDISANKGYHIHEFSEQNIAGYTVITSTQKEVLGIFKVLRERQVYLQGKNTVFTFVIIASCAILLFGIVILIFFEYLLLHRLSVLSKEVKEISIRDLQNTRVHEHGNDEIGTLATSINDLLQEVTRAQEDEKKAQELEKEVSIKLQKSLEETQEMNRLMVGRELKMIELKKELEQAQKKS